MHSLLLVWAVLFPPGSLRRSVTVVSAKGVFGTVMPLVAMPSTYDGWMHVVQGLVVFGVSTATFVSICLDISRKRREAVDFANRKDRMALAHEYFRKHREGKKKHIRRAENNENNP
jgi:hypothetical protein